MEDPETVVLTLEEAAGVLYVEPEKLRQIIDAGALLPSSLQLAEGGVWDVQSTFGFKRKDIDRFREELDRREFLDIRAKYHNVIDLFSTISCGPGWSSLIRQAAVAASAFDPAWNVMLKGAVGKHGMLLLDFSCERREGRLPVFRLKETIRKRSLSTCEECGKPGRLRQGKSLCRTLCDDHARLVGDLRDDDGMNLDPWEAP